MLKILSVDGSELKNLRRSHLKRFSAPMDGMWLAFADSADFFLLQYDGKPAGFYCLNERQEMLQFHVEDAYLDLAEDFFATSLANHQIMAAQVPTMDALFLSVAMGRAVSIVPHTLCYQNVTSLTRPAAVEMEQAKTADFESCYQFQYQQVGAPKDWLTSYCRERIRLGELFVLRRNGLIVATGECRMIPDQDGFADLGLIVRDSERCRGLGATVISFLTEEALRLGCRPICSTTSENIPAQIMLAKAGYRSRHRVSKVWLLPNSIEVDLRSRILDQRPLSEKAFCR